MKRIGRNALCTMLFVLLLAGCDSVSDDDGATAPPVLPADAFSLKTDLFNQTNASKSMAGTHFAAAALRVWPVSVIISANLIVPVAVTAAALQANPERDGTTWTWTTTTVANGREITSQLAGTLQGSSVRWSMRVSYFDGEQTLDEFELYTAVTDASSQTGSWKLYYPINGQSRNVLNADFAVPSETEATITYSIPASAENNAGDSVRYEADDNARTFDWTQVGEALNHLIIWDADTRVGSIDATNYNQGQKACWDEDLENSACLDG